MKEDKLIAKDEKVSLSRALRLFVFIEFLALSIIMSGDLGVVSSSSQMIKYDLNLSDSEYGIFGSLTTTGKIFGSLLFIGILSFKNRKIVIAIILTLHGGAFFVYLFTKNKWILFGVRFVIGTLRVFPHIYLPVWVDQFGIMSLKTLMMTVINISSPLGQVCGYAIGTYNIPENWANSFALIGSIILAIDFMFIITPSRYFSSEYKFSGYEEDASGRSGTSIFSSSALLKKGNRNEGESILSLFASGSYIFSIYSRANIIFIFYTIRLFITDYLTKGVQMNDKNSMLYYYSLASVFGPALGGSFGGLITTKVGGYNHKNSVFVCIAFSICTLILSFPLAYSTDTIVFSISLFSFFFFCTAMLPTLFGYIVSSVPIKHSLAASSFNLLVTTFLGILPGPICYGYINDVFKDNNPTFAWKCTVFYYFFGFGSILLACTFRYKELSRESVERNHNHNLNDKENDDQSYSDVSAHMADIAEGNHSELVQTSKPGAIN